jgi:nucleotide-binding universal stress UspA family protein
MVHKVVVAYDGSESSRVALTWAAGAAAARGLPVLVVNVLTDASRAVAERMLLAAEHEARREVTGVELETRVCEGPVVPTLLALLDDAEMAVVGSRGVGGFSELVLGSTALRLVEHARCPVVVVRSLGFEAPGPEADRVLVGVDGSAASSEAIGFAFAEASLRGCGLTAVHAWEPPFVEIPVKGIASYEEFLAAIERTEMRVLSESLAGWREKYPDVDVRQRLVRGSPARILVESSPGARLAVVGSRGQGGFTSLLLGSVSHAVVHHARCAVAVVRRQQG